MKKFFYIISVVCALCAMFAAGCGDSPSDNGKDAVTITFETNGGSVVDPVSIPYDTALPASYFGTGNKVPVKTGYGFTGWKNGAADVTAQTKFIENTELSAQWAANPVITFNTNGGTPETIASETLPYNTALPAAYFGTGNKVPAKTGYVFAGWKDGTADVTAATRFTQNTELTAQWAIEVTVSFNLGEIEGVPVTGTPPVNVIIFSGTALGSKYPANPTAPPDYDFNGWFNGEKQYDRNERITTEESTFILTAHWVEVDYNIYPQIPAIHPGRHFAEVYADPGDANNGIKTVSVNAAFSIEGLFSNIEPGNGVLSAQWYRAATAAEFPKEGTAIGAVQNPLGGNPHELALNYGGTEPAAGTFYYWAAVTNTDENATTEDKTAVTFTMNYLKVIVTGP